MVRYRDWMYIISAHTHPPKGKHSVNYIAVETKMYKIGNRFNLEKLDSMLNHCVAYIELEVQYRKHVDQYRRNYQ